MHCNQPACLTNAMEKTKEGSVIWNADKCMGCRFCMISYSFEILKFEYKKANPSIKKCTNSRLKENKLPSCVDACPNKIGGTSVLYLAQVPFETLGFNTTLSDEALPESTIGFL